MSTTSTPAPAPAPKESWISKVWGWIENEVTHVEAGIEDLFGSNVAQAIEQAGKSIIQGEYGPLVTQALAEATDVVTGQMSVSKAISALVSLFEQNGKTLSQAAALQLIGVAQNALPAKPATITPVA